LPKFHFSQSFTGKKKKKADAAAAEGKAAGGHERRLSVAEKSVEQNVTLDDFVLLTTVGQGSFGKVIQVRKKDTGEILAMKILKKDHVIKRKQLEHTMAERKILEEIEHPYIVSLRFAFQTTQKLYMVFGKHYPFTT
jgi:serine/threonine protein kinase